MSEHLTPEHIEALLADEDWKAERYRPDFTLEQHELLHRLIDGEDA